MIKRDEFQHICDALQAQVVALQRAHRGLEVAILVLEVSDDIAPSGLPAVQQSGVVTGGMSIEKLEARLSATVSGIKKRAYQKVIRSVQ